MRRERFLEKGVSILVLAVVALEEYSAPLSLTSRSMF